MMRKFIIAGAALAALTAPALSAQGWYVIQSLADHECFAVSRIAEPGEQQLGGPFASQSAAQRALGQKGACLPRHNRD